MEYAQSGIQTTQQYCEELGTLVSGVSGQAGYQLAAGASIVLPDMANKQWVKNILVMVKTTTGGLYINVNLRRYIPDGSAYVDTLITSTATSTTWTAVTAQLYGTKQCAIVLKNIHATTANDFWLIASLYGN